ncbi:MAG: DUF1857 family protein [Zoogloeaceae bacterium]|jgi:hypothetical protein|nr:DUF1857 family protein [Zoogloeaceae bacterium]
MYFEHLVKINAPDTPALAFLSREALWRALWQRVEHPERFLPGLETCVILERDAAGLCRRLDFGNTCIHDRVRHLEGEWLRFEVAAADDHAGGTLTITLEEPEPGLLGLRFAYQTTLDLRGEQADYAEYIKAAYQDSDLETVRVIRRIAAEFNAPPA